MMEKSNKKKNSVIILSLALAAVIIAIAAVGIVMVINGGVDKNPLSVANKAYENHDYETAIKYYWMAINEDKSNESAYILLGQSYEALNDFGNAAVVYNTGYQSTESDDLFHFYREAYFREYNVYPVVKSIRAQEEENREKKDNNSQENAKLSLNTTLLAVLGNATHEEYVSKFGAATVTPLSSGGYSVRYTGFSGSFGYVTPVTIDESTYGPKNDKRPDYAMLDSLATLFVGAEGRILFSQIKNMELGNVTKTAAGGSTVVKFTYGNCVITINADENGDFDTDAVNKIEITGEQVDINKYDLTGYVIDSVTGDALFDVKVTLINDSSSEERETYSERDGSYVFEDLPEGQYEVVIEEEDYIEFKAQIDVEGYEKQIQKNLPLSKKLAHGALRVVLQWGTTPRDLDSYVFGTTSEGKDVRNYYDDPEQYFSNGEPAVKLDIDEQYGEGPETTTIYDTMGSYEFIVYRCSNDGYLSSSGATVTIYYEDEVTTLTVPDGIERTWSVFKIEKGVLTITDENADGRYAEHAAYK